MRCQTTGLDFNNCNIPKCSKLGRGLNFPSNKKVHLNYIVEFGSSQITRYKVRGMSSDWLIRINVYNSYTLYIRVILFINTG